MKCKTGIIKRFVNSIYNVDEFPKYVRYGVPKAIIYALFLSLFIGGIEGTFKFINVNNNMNEVSNMINQDEYNFKIDNNYLKLDNSPIMFEDNRMLFYVDQDIKIAEADELRKITVNKDVNFLVLKDGLFIKTNGEYDNIGDIKLYYSEMSLDREIKNSDIINIIQSSKPMICVLIIGTYILQGFFMYIISAFFIAVLTIIPSKLLGVNYRLSDLFSLVIYAYTLPNLLVMVLSIVFPNILFDTAGMIGAIVYTYLAIRHVRNQIN